MDDYRFAVVVGKNAFGWVAVCPEFGDCEAPGETYADALENIRDVIQIRIEDCLADDEEIPQAEIVNLTTLRLGA